MSFYLLEIGCEELPAAFVPMAANYVNTEAVKQLAALHLPYTELRSGGTPRRIYLYINGLPEKQEDREETVQGPPAKLAFNEDGSVSEMGLKFAKAKGLDESTLTKAATDKGDYLTGIKKIKGEAVSELLPDVISNIIRNIPFAKSMRWGDKDIRFARPLHYLLSIWDGKILPLNIEEFPVVSTTEGHRFLAPQTVNVTDFASYQKVLKEGFVVVDEAERKDMIVKEMDELSKKGGYEVDKDDKLLETVANLVEYPYAIEGEFDGKFLELPAPVLITSMKYHQKYFPAYKDGKLQSKFIGISNMKPDNGGTLIRQGYERVLSARLNDAMFFYENDRKKPLAEMVEMLKKVTYQEKLGTSYEKMERFRALAASIAGDVAKDRLPLVERAAALCKADLMSEMVYEFPELQGFMGKVYAGLQGEDAEVASAIEEHYMPRFAGDDVPESISGKIIAIADKLDTIAGAFAVDMIPTGNVDPYGLRRNAIGIINIIEQAGWRLAFKALVIEALELVKSKATADTGESLDKILNFFMQRHKQQLISAGSVEADAYDAAAVNFSDFISQKAKAEALTAAKKSDSFKSIAQSFKRINNILKKSDHSTVKVDPALFQQDEETSLYNTLGSLSSKIEGLVKSENWTEATASLSEFAAPLEAFFDKVMVMADDEKVKNNRLSLLSSLRELFVTVGDLGEII